MCEWHRHGEAGGIVKSTDHCDGCNLLSMGAALLSG